MRQRAAAGAAAVGVAAVVVVVALVAGSGGGAAHRALPVLGAAGGGAAADEMTSTPVPGGGGPGYELTADPSGLPSEASAWVVHRSAGDAGARALTDAFGLGEVVASPEGWTASGDDGFLTVEDQPGLPWYYSAMAVQVDPVVAPPPDTAVTSQEDAAAPGAADGDATCVDGATCDPGPCPDDTASCATSGPATTVPGATAIGCQMPECPPGSACVQVCPEPGPGGSTEPVPLPEPEPPADLPTAEEAEVIARSTLAAAGIDLHGTRTRMDDGFSVWVLVADPVVGGLPTFGMTTSVGVGADGLIEFASGWLGDPERGDAYDLVGVDAALDRLAEASGWVSHAPGPRADCPDCDGAAPPAPVRLDAIEVGLQLVPAYGAEEAWLVPSYLFGIADAGAGAVVAAFAVADEHLAEPGVTPGLVDPIPVDGGIGDGAGPPRAGEGACAEATGSREVPLAPGSYEIATTVASGCGSE